VTPRLIINPADDGDFVAAVRDLVSGHRGWRSFEADLRTRYPEATVRASELSGQAGERWYVYRDGRWAGDGSGILDQPTTSH
jgi:hypothetical protein